MRKRISFVFALASFSATAFPADRHIAFKRNDAVYIADLDGTSEKKIADGIFPAISPDGTRIAFNTVEKKSDTTYVRHMSRSGRKCSKEMELSKILTDASMNSKDRLSVSPDGKTLLMDVDCGSEHERKNWDGPQPAIEKFDLTAEKAVRVTGKDDFVWEPFWLSSDELLCIMQKENENQPSIYRMSLNGKSAKLLVKHARTPTASAP